jgi:PPOX class probable F420-dependent enzyme
MSTVTPEHRPHVVPFVFALIETGSEITAYWAVDRKPKLAAPLKRIRNLEHNAAVEFVVDGYDENWELLWWVRCSGTGRVVASDAERGSALDALMGKYPQYVAASPPGPVVAIDVDTIEGWEATPPG